MANELIVSLTNNLAATLDAVSTSLPKDFNRDRFIQNAIAVVNKNLDLLKYNQNELLTCMANASFLGLDFMNQEAWIVPYSGHVQFQIGYKGACKFAKKYSIRPLSDIYAKEVKKGDELEYGINEKNEPYLHWKPVPFNDSEIIGVFAVAFFEDGGMMYEVMSKADVDKIRKVSRCGNSGPWKDYYGEMAKKTVLKKLAKNIVSDFDNIEQRSAWDSDNDVEFKAPEPAAVVDPFAEKDSKAIEVEATVVDIPDVENFK